LIGSKDIAKTSIWVTLTYFLKIGQKAFNGLIWYQFGENLAQIG